MLTIAINWEDMNRKNIFIIFTMIILFGSCGEKYKHDESTDYNNMKIRIAAITVDSIYIDEYLAILKEEAAASVKLEDGVLCIYPMYQKENPTEIRLLEIYANEEAYQSHLKTSHFLHYKNTTLKMVKSLELIDMEAIDEKTMSDIFTKIK